VGDPASGYIKELRIKYKIGDAILEKNAMEHEPLNINASSEDELKILKAVFGKFERGIDGIPASNPVYDVTEKVRAMTSSGVLEIFAKDDLVDGIEKSQTPKALRIIYHSNGEIRTTTVAEGDAIKLTQEGASPKLVVRNGEVHWHTPYPGAITFTTSTGTTKTIEVEEVPKPVTLSGAWEVDFPVSENVSMSSTFSQLASWTTSSNDDIRYFSGTANYTKQFELPKKLLQSETSITLDLGSVYTIAEVTLNGENLGVLWKAPFTMNIDDFVQEGTNKLEVKITNLWPNRLIGDEQLSLDFERNGKGIKQWPDWLINNTERPTERVTFADYQHWDKYSELQVSGLLGPVQIIVSKVQRIK
jgi:hypothetical protein